MTRRGVALGKHELFAQRRRARRAAIRGGARRGSSRTHPERVARHSQRTMPRFAAVPLSRDTTRRQVLPHSGAALT